MDGELRFKCHVRRNKQILRDESEGRIMARLGFFIHKVHGAFAFIPSIVWEYEYNILYIQFLWWNFGVEW